MLKPAICYKTEIENAMKQFFYTDDMMYYTCSNESLNIDISSESKNGKYCYAITDTKGKLVGYVAYCIDWYSLSAWGFGAISFDRGNPIMGRDLFRLFEKLIKRLHRVEFRAVEGNPAIKGYDNFLKRHSDIGKKLVLTDIFKDTNGNYHDEYIYEFINQQAPATAMTQATQAIAAQATDTADAFSRQARAIKQALADALAADA